MSSSTTSIHLDCNYNNAVLTGIGHVYRCTVKNRLNILNKSYVDITSANGTHLKNKSNNDVTAYYSAGKIIEYFPKKLNQVFVNLKLIDISYDYLKEVRQADLKEYPKLVYLMLSNNPIEIIEEGLFDYNPDLIFIGLSYCNIVHIDPKVFDGLVKLDHLWLRGNPCVTRYVKDDKDYVGDLKKLMKDICVDNDFSELYAEVQELEVRSGYSDCKKFGEKVKMFEKKVTKSKHSDSHLLNRKVEKLSNSACSKYLF